MLQALAQTGHCPSGWVISCVPCHSADVPPPPGCLWARKPCSARARFPPTSMSLRQQTTQSNGIITTVVAAAQNHGSHFTRLYSFHISFSKILIHWVRKVAICAGHSRVGQFIEVPLGFSWLWKQRNWHKMIIFATRVLARRSDSVLATRATLCSNALQAALAENSFCLHCQVACGDAGDKDTNTRKMGRKKEKGDRPYRDKLDPVPKPLFLKILSTSTMAGQGT